jgi:hypothetical protein
MKGFERWKGMEDSEVCKELEEVKSYEGRKV